ncbi:MAG: efflux transporter outer membrane subunit [Deltaproteobacteria bacterium]|nr:efflux transporter outer membrane subunit [Deltaproteobacteria bacterium]
MNRRLIPLACALLSAPILLGGCTMMPKYERPGLPVADSFKAEAGAASAAAPAAHEAAPAAALAATDVPWQDFFTDERLRSVIDLALANNRDLRVATLNVERVAGLHRIQRSELFPTIGVQATGEKYRIPESIGKDGQASTVSTYTVGLGMASWELDLFGRIRSLNARSLEQYLATEEARRGAQTSLVAAVAATWLDLAASEENLLISKATLEAQRDSYDLIRQSRDAGIGSDLELSQAQSQVEAARAAVAAYSGAVGVSRIALDLLAGTPVPADLLPERLVAVTDPKGLSTGLPSDVLLRRPDILAAEHLLRAANASIGAARAAFFPRISLTAGFGTSSPDLDGLFKSGTSVWNLAGQIVSPLFASGSLIANLKVSKLDREIAVAQYEKAIQTAFAEVNDSLTLRTTLVEQRDAQEALVKSLEDFSRLSDARFKAGLDGYLGVLVAQQALFNAQRGAVGTRLAEQANLVTLYKVLGGGV